SWDGTMTEASPSTAIESESDIQATPPAPVLVRKRFALIRWLLAPLRWGAAGIRSAIRRPLRALGIVLLLILFCFGAYIGGMHTWAWYPFGAGRDALERYHTLDAVEHLQACLSVWPNDPDCLAMSARAMRRLEMFDLAEAYLEQAKGMRGKHADPILERMLLRLARGDAEQLGKTCQAKGEQKDPDSGLILEALNPRAIPTYQIRKAGLYTQRWLEREPDNPQAYFLRGLVLEYMGLRQEAAGAFRRALEIDPEHDEARLHLATQLLDLLRGGEAIPHFEYLQT